MSLHGGWIETFLPTVTEVQAAGLVLVIFGVAAYVYPDAKDQTAVVAAVGILFVVLGFVGPPIVLEWHYWLIGGVVIALLILLFDKLGAPRSEQDFLARRAGFQQVTRWIAEA